MPASTITPEQRFTGVEAIEIDSDAAGITLTRAEAEETSVALVDRDGGALPEDLLHVEQDGGALRVRVTTVRGGRWRRRNRTFTAQLRIETPAHVGVQVRADAGSVRVEQRDADVSVDTRAGGVRLDGVRGTIDVRSNAGAVQLTDTLGRATVESDVGAVRVERHLGERLEIRTSAGAVRATSLEVGALQVRTEAGAVTLDCATPPVEVDASCAVGAITLSLPRDEYEIEQRLTGLSRARLDGIGSVPGASRRVRVASTGVGRITVAERSAR